MKRTILHMIMLLAALTAGAQEFSAGGQVIGWTTVNPFQTLSLQGGVRYLPQFNFEIPVGPLNLEGEVSLNARGNSTWIREDTTMYDAEVKPYRAWMKLSGDQFELRAGLQKINFGSASMLRPLMWFDRIDPRDPLQLTDGVYALLGRYYFLNNANFWVWGLYGNNERKGWEAFPPVMNSIEFGGRAQVPLFTGELAATYHHRTADPDRILPAPGQVGITVPEDRLAIDGKFDLGAGLWFEGAWTGQRFHPEDIVGRYLLNAGADYTFRVGTGLNIMAEGLAVIQEPGPVAGREEIYFGGLSLNYGIGLIQNISAIVFYDFTNSRLYRFLNWSVSLDTWTFYTMAFWNPETYQLIGYQQDAGLFSGAGFQLMAVFNY